MKTIHTSALAALLLSTVLFLDGCKKKDPEPGLSAKIQQIVPQVALDDMKAKGMIINEGNSPPNIEGIFEGNPFTLLTPYGPEDSYAKGRVTTSYRWRFTGQKNDDVQVEEKQLGGTGSSTGTASFLAGSGKKFSLFGQLIGTQGNASYKQLVVISGEITDTGIKDFQYALLFTEKTGAGSGNLIPINKARIWIDGNQLASKTTTFRIGAIDNPQPVLNLPGMGTSR